MRIMNKKSSSGVTEYLGVFHKKRSLFEGTALILSGTIGAGIVGIPFVVSHIGVGLGILYIVLVGMLMIGLNILIGELAVKIGKPLQLVGFAEHYFGKAGKWFMTLLLYSLLIGVLVVYIIGEGQALQELFGGSRFVWSLVFFIIASTIIAIGLRTAKTVELLLTLFILAVVLALAAVSASHIKIPHITTFSFADILLPYGVLLFAFHGTTSIPEAHATLRGDQKTFRKAIFLAGIISIIVYALFTFIVIRVTAEATTEIATIGLGRTVGPSVFYLANIFSVLAMGTSCVMAGLALRDSLRWDFRLSYMNATVLTCGVPMVLFLLGLRGFISVIGLVGGVLMSVEMIILTLIYLRAKQRKDWHAGPFKLHYTMLLVTLLLLGFTVGAVYSVLTIF